MTPAAAIAALDRQLAQHGQDVVLQRFATDSEGVQTLVNEATCRAAVDTEAPQELVPFGGEAPNTHLIMSPTDLVAAMWPGLPIKDDRLLIDGIPNNVEIVKARSIGNHLVRIELQTRT